MQKKEHIVPEENYQNVFYNSPQPMWIVDDEELCFQTVNKAALNLYGYNEKEFLSLKITDLIHSSALPSSKKDIQSRFTRESFTDIHFGKNGTRFVVDVKTSKLFFNNSESFLAIIESVKEKTALPLSAGEIDEFHAHILSQITEAVVVFSIDGKIIFWNNGAERIYGYSKEEAIGKTSEGVFRRTSGTKEDDEMVNSSLVTMGEWKSLDIHTTKHGDKIFVESTTRLMRGKNNEITGIFSLLRNVTDRVKAEEELRRSKEELNVILRSVADGITVQDIKGSLVYANDSAAQMCGFSNVKELLSAGSEEVIKRFYLMDENGDPLPVEKLPGRQALKGITGASAVVKFKNLENKFEGWTQIMSSPVFDENGNVRLAINVFHDISDQRKAEEEVKISEERFRLLVDQSPLSKQIISPDGYTIKVNKSWERLFGSRAEDLADYNVFNDPQLIKNGAVSLMKNALKGESSFLPPFKLYPEKGDFKGMEVWIQAYIYPLKDHDNSVKELVIIHENITERKVAEEKIEASLKEKEILLKEVHHRVKNNMQIIYSLLNLQSNTITDNKSIEAFKESQNRIRSMALIHEKLYQSKELSKIDLPGYIKELVLYLVGSYVLDSEKIKINMDIANVEVSVDVAISLGLIINELVTNSLKYAFPENKKGQLDVKMQIQNENFYKLVIADNGKGMPPGFDLSNSTSLGLQLVNTLIEQLNGSVKLNGEKGTSFVLTLPSLKK